MTKEEFLAMSLPYGLKCNAINDEYFNPVLSKELYRIETGKTEKLKDYDYSYIVGDVECYINDITPVLHPLSDLTKEIEHNGENFVPIVRLAKINFGSNFINILKVFGCDNSFVKFIGRGDTGGEYPEYTYNEVLFEFNHRLLSFCVNHLDDMHLTNCDSINQLELLLKLIEWHFAVGIDESEYIDVNTIKMNPYK